MNEKTTAPKGATGNSFLVDKRFLEMLALALRGEPSLRPGTEMLAEQLAALVARA